MVDNGDNTYTVTYADLPKYIDGEEVSYSVMEKEIQGYVQSASVVKNGGTLVNTEVKEPLPDRNSDEKTPTDTEVTPPLPDGSDNQAAPTETEESHCRIIAAMYRQRQITKLLCQPRSVRNSLHLRQGLIHMRFSMGC